MKSLTYVEIDVLSFVETSPESVETFRFAEDAGYLPADIEAIPSISNVDMKSATVSLGKDLGQRASVTVSFLDHKHIFAAEPFNQGSFWGKWRGRYGAKLRGRPIRIIRGFLGQSLEQMETRHYVIESTNGPTLDGTYEITAKDLLKLADDDRAQAPLLSNGELAGNIDDSTTTAVLSPAGIGNLEYPASGFVCIGGKEICSFTRSADTLTMTRAQKTTLAIAHEAGERVQLCLDYTGDDVADVIADLFENYAGIDSSHIPLTEWQDETAAHLSVIYAATITEPTSVNKLVSEMIEQSALAVYWDDAAQLIRLKVLREISTDAATFDESNIIENSLSIREQLDKRISRMWTFYGQRNPADRSDNEDNYRAALADLDSEREIEYGSSEIRKIQARWIQTFSAAERLNGIQLSRFRDPPRRFNFDLFRGQEVLLAEGYRLGWWGSQDASGERVTVPIQITRVSRDADLLHIEAEEMLASGVVVVTHTILLINTGGVFTFVLPDSWNDDDNLIACIGGGGGGGADDSGRGGRGGGGGAYSASTNLALSGSPNPSYSYRVGAGGGTETSGGDSWFGNATFAGADVGARGGQRGLNQTGEGLGGQSASGIGDVRFSGGDGGEGSLRDSSTSRAAGGGGGGAAGPNGDGGDGGDGEQIGGGHNATAGGGGGAGNGGGNGSPGGVPTAKIGGQGGNNRFGFGGGGASESGVQSGGGGGGGYFDGPGGPGGVGEQLWTQTEAPIFSAGPAGGGGGGARLNNGGGGGLYGGGGGGNGAASGPGSGAQGVIILRWKEAE